MKKVMCPYCDELAKLVDSEEVYYGRSYDQKMYLCRPCKAWVGCHKGTETPLGRLANAELRGWKMAAHKAFDLKWRDNKSFTRRQAYQWLADKLGISGKGCHIGEFDLYHCKEVVRICEGGE